MVGLLFPEPKVTRRRIFFAADIERAFRAGMAIVAGGDGHDEGEWFERRWEEYRNSLAASDSSLDEGKVKP
jgi:hypothetical protein